jgi:hypothetical protein
LTPDGKHFYGLGLDEENQVDLHNSRLDKWFDMLVGIFNLSVEEIEPIQVIEDVVPSIEEKVSKSSNSEQADLVDGSIAEDDSSDQDNTPLVTRRYSSSEKIGLFYGSTTGNSEEICDKIQETLGEDVIELLNVSEVDSNQTQISSEFPVVEP